MINVHLKFSMTPQKYLGDCYEVDLLWARNDVMLPDNHAMVVACIKRVRKHLRNSPGVLVKYKYYINEMLRMGQTVINGDNNVKSY